MKSKFIVQINNDLSLELRGELSKSELKAYQRAKPKMVYDLISREVEGDSLRKFFEGACCPYFAYQHLIFDKEKGRWYRMPIIQARKTIKREFNAEYIRRLDGTLEQQGKSTKGKEVLNKVLGKLQEWFMENGYIFPDSKDYNAWVKSAPLIKEIYPPLKEIVERSNSKLLELNMI